MSKVACYVRSNDTGEAITDKLWNPGDWGPILTSRSENARVRGVYADELARHNDHALTCKCPACGQFRGDFAREMVAVCEANGLHVPGQDRRTELREGETEHSRRVDAARTNIRQFVDGKRGAPAWMLCAIETTIAVRRGMALPPCAYQVQATLAVEA